MAGDHEVPEAFRAKQSELEFDLDRTLHGVMALRSEIPADAFTASILGTERFGSGVLIREDGLVLTIGYLVTEAERVWLTARNGQVVEGHVLAYDQVTGFGLVQALARVGLPVVPLGQSQSCAVGDTVVVAGAGGPSDAVGARVTAKQEFAGYWEYLLDEALFTAPAHPHWGGTACLDRHGRLLGIGSLLVQQGIGARVLPANMIVPIDLLPPILDDLLRGGRCAGPPRPWLGLYACDGPEGVSVTGLARGGPAHRAKLLIDDRILAVGEVPVATLADFYRAVWSLGPAGVEVPLVLVRDGRRVTATLVSIDRNSILKRPRLH
jgi:S1-C subfamily serine protease